MVAALGREQCGWSGEAVVTLGYPGGGATRSSPPGSASSRAARSWPGRRSSSGRLRPPRRSRPYCPASSYRANMGETSTPMRRPSRDPPLRPTGAEARAARRARPRGHRSAHRRPHRVAARRSARSATLAQRPERRPASCCSPAISSACAGGPYGRSGSTVVKMAVVGRGTCVRGTWPPCPRAAALQPVAAVR